MKRREFIALAATAAAGGCASAPRPNAGSAAAPQNVDAGPASAYQADGVYAAFRMRGFFIVRRDGKLIALSSVCTHRACKVEAEPDKSFYCPCHGSTFDPTGRVKEGPAVRDLPVLPSHVDDSGHLIVAV